MTDTRRAAAQPPTWRRRLAAFGVLAVAAGALIATSPPRPDESTLSATFAGGAGLTAAEPMTGRVTLDVSAAALPLLDDSLKRINGTVTFSGAHEGIRLVVRPIGVAAEPDELAGETTWAIAQLCRVAEPCRREFDVTLELLGAPAGERRFGRFQATLEITYTYIDANPAGATASWTGSAELALPTAPPATTQSP